MKPGGNYVMNSLDKIGGIPLIMKKLMINPSSFQCVNCHWEIN